MVSLNIIKQYDNFRIDEVLFQSSLKKVINKANSSIIYSERFCTITKMEFRCYKSKEQFLTLQKPIQVIPFFEIIDICLVNIKPNSRKLDHLQIRIYKKRANKQPRRSPILENTKRKINVYLYLKLLISNRAFPFTFYGIRKNK